MCATNMTAINEKLTGSECEREKGGMYGRVWKE